MKKTNNSKKPQENTLFSYFKKVKDPAVKPRESLSTIITKTSSSSSTTVTKKNNGNATKTSVNNQVSYMDLDDDPPSIDLTQDDDLIVLPPLPKNSQPLSTATPTTATSSQSSPFSSQSSFGSRERVHNQEMKNTSKYNNKGWLAQSIDMEYKKSSLKPSSQASQAPQQKFERLVLKKARITPKPSYDWLTPDDVKPYSSNHRPYTTADNKIMHIKKPEITVIRDYSSLSQDSIGERGSKRGWDDSFDSSSIPVYRGSNNARSKPGWEDRYGSSSPSSSQQSNASNSQQYIAPSYTSQNFASASISSSSESANNISRKSNVDAASFWDAALNKNKNNNSDNDYIKIKQEKFGAYNNYNDNYNSKVKMEKFASPSYNSGFNINSNTDTSSKEYRPELSDEQQRVLDMVLNERKSLFFTGSAGTGKSVLLRAIIDKLGERYGSQLAVTASTGIAACNINGCTLHR